jgi:endonuclease/exonuclease/phosphatase family metal-dependent hydrolase
MLALPRSRFYPRETPDVLAKRRLYQVGTIAAALVACALSGVSAARPPDSRASRSEVSSDPLVSAAACATELAAGRRLSRAPGVARFASWNLHWFPDGKPGSGGSGADLHWLACAVWWLDADVVAVQEVKQTRQAELALGSLLVELSRLSGGRYRARVDDCGSRVPQHVGLIWNEARVQATELETVAALNPSGEACAKQWRPGLAARFRFPGGLDLLTISAHFKSMADLRSLELRRASFTALPGIALANEAKSRDPDLLLLGDLNTMGCESCSPPVTAQQELASVAKTLEPAGLRLVPADAPGSHWHDGQTTLLDHALAAGRMRELAPRARSHVAGMCAAGTPARRLAKKVRHRLSDHCPIVLDLTDRDLD